MHIFGEIQKFKSVSFCGLTKGISPKFCILCVRLIINKRSFEPFCVWTYLKAALLAVVAVGVGRADARVVAGVGQDGGVGTEPRATRLCRLE